MKVLRPTTEADMIAVFLKGEITSERFGQYILNQLTEHQKDRGIVDQPDITNEAENAYRHQLLGSYRSYVFEEIPPHTLWYRASLSPQEVSEVRYIDYSMTGEWKGTQPCSCPRVPFATPLTP